MARIWLLRARMRSFSALVLVVLAGCGVSEAELSFEGEDQASTGWALTFTATESVQVLALVNDPATGNELLNDFIALDSRAARNILTHRAGADALYPSADDDRFDTLAELDAIPYVGDTALLKLRWWAGAHPLPVGELVEGVDFTADQVTAVLWGVNRASLTELDVAVALDARAATALVAGRPYSSITALGAIAWVGPTALLALQAYAVTWNEQRWGQPPATLAGTFDGVSFDEAQATAALALTNTASRDALVAAGVPATGAAPLVGNRPFASLIQVAAVSGVGPSTLQALKNFVTPGTVALDGVCSTTNRCQAGLVCAGLSLNPEGLCRPSWMAGTFASTTLTAIPDANAAGITSTIVVSGLASVPEDLIVHLDIVHPRKADLRIVLTQPSSAESLVWDVGSTGATRVIPRGAEYDSMVNGQWTLQVIDTQGGSVGSLRGWSLELTSRWD